MQKGGVFIINKDPEKSINFFLDNCLKVEWMTSTAGSASGVIFECILQDSVRSPYEMIRASNFKSPVKKIIIKIVGIDSEEDEHLYWSVPIRGFNDKRLEKEETFQKEVNIQTDIFLKSITYLNPLCPAPIYASIKKKYRSGNSFFRKNEI